MSEQLRQILHVDDNPGDVRLIAIATTRAKVRAVASGDEALRFLRQRSPL